MKALFSFLKSFTKTQTIKDASLVTVGMGLSTILSALSIFLIARFLGPAGFGLYVTALGLSMIVIDSLELAISGSIINFSSKPSKSSKEFIKYGFKLKLVLGFLVGLIFAAASQTLAPLLHFELTRPLLVASFFIPIVFLQRFPRSILQAQKKFLSDSAIEVITSLSRLLFVLGFYYLFKLTVITALISYLLGAFLAFLFGSFFISWKFLETKITPLTKQSFFSFQKWLTLGFILAAIHGRIDSAILLRLVGPETTGIYQAAFRFFMPILSFTAVLSLIFTPRFASFPDYKIARSYLKKALALSLGLASLVLLIIPLAPFLVKLIFGPNYLEAVLPTQILALGFFAFVAGAPLASHLIYSTKRTKVFFIVNLIQIILLVGLDLLLIPLYKAVGAALAVSITLIIINSLLGFLALSYEKAD
ncbi:MAG: oligosaccharide flippase family protein [Candidatus Beckwithbacteria bacterium]